MKTKLKLRSMSAYFAPMKIFCGDNEPLQVQLCDCGKIKGKAYLLFNGCAFVFDGNGELTIPTEAISDVNFCELQERDETGKVTAHWATESLFRLPTDREYRHVRLLAERRFYDGYIRRLAADVEALRKEIAVAEKTDATNARKLAELENGKFTLFKFKEETKK